MLEDILGVLRLVIEDEGSPAPSTDETLRVGQDALHSDLCRGLGLLALNSHVRRLQQHPDLSVLANDQLPAVRCHHHPVLLGLIRQPRKGQVVLCLPLGQGGRQLLDSAVADPERLEDSIAAHADERGVQGAEGCLVKGGSLLGRGADGRPNLGLLPKPDH